ncbi:MAG TPA: hypothetical protein VMR41_05925 [Patescibacteria group bacterium]|nr:hypothetical protein [Patescibacteria group bacterium]
MNESGKQQINKSNSSSISSFQSQGTDTYEKLNEMFSVQDQQRKTILEARDILGESANNLSDEQVFSLVNELQFLVDSWLEEYEKNTFDGKTLNELLNTR